MKKLHEEFPRDLQLQNELDGHPINATKLATSIPQLIIRIKKWIKKIELKVRNAKRYLVLDGTKYIDEDVEVPGESLLPQEPKTFVKVSKVLAQVDVVDLFDAIGKEIAFLGNNGRVYKFLFMTDGTASHLVLETRREERVCQLRRLLNPLLAKRRQTSWRGLYVNSLRIIPVAPLFRLIESIDGSVTLWDIFQQHCDKKKLDRDSPQTSYYTRIKSPQLESATPLADSALRDVYNNIQQNYVPPTILQSWARESFPTKMEYLAFKSRFLYSVATQSIISHGYGLNCVHPSRWLIDRSTGAIYVQSQKMDNTRPSGFLPPFRRRILKESTAWLITQHSISRVTTFFVLVIALKNYKKVEKLNVE